MLRGFWSLPPVEWASAVSGNISSRKEINLAEWRVCPAILACPGQQTQGLGNTEYRDRYISSSLVIIMSLAGLWLIIYRHSEIYMLPVTTVVAICPRVQRQ